MRAILVVAVTAGLLPWLGAGVAQAAPSTVTSFTPTSGAEGVSVTITGTGFNDAPSPVSGVTFGGTAATVFNVVSDTQLTASVPAGAASGPIAVTDSEGTGTSATHFIVTSAGVTVTSFTPTSGPIGTSVQITGTGFTGATRVWFGGVLAATHTVNSDTQVTATVPAGALSGPIAVESPSGTGVSSTDFTISAAEHDRSVNLKLRKHLIARGRVSSDFEDCQSDVTVRVQRRKPGAGWQNVGRGTTNDNGGFRIEVRDRPGRYRALAPEVSLDSDVCLAANSGRVRHSH